MTYIFDIDGTICTNTNGKYSTAQPLQDRITIVNKLYDQGHTIHFLTARGMGRSGNSTAFAYDAFEDLTRQQLKEWGVKYHRLFLGKPSGDFYIDDKGIKDEDFFNTRD
jgi:hypothetical protein|tara:strand:- start:4051 stop:4377 length:327 start_codon:yes stop_codon:yes gene_type:complete